MESGEHSSIAGGSANCTDTMEISMAVSQKIGNQSTSRPKDITLRHILKVYSIMPQHTSLTMLIAALFVIARTWKQARCPSTEE